MKVKAVRVRTVPQFVPIELTLRFETQDELDAMAAIFNSCVLAASIPDSMKRAQIWRELMNLGAKVRNTEASDKINNLLS